MKRFIVSLLSLFISLIAFAQYPCHGSMKASYDSDFNLVINGHLTNDTNSTITSVEVCMYYGDVLKNPNNAWKRPVVIQVSIKPGQTQSFSINFDESANGVKAHSCSISRVRFSDGSIYRRDGLDRNGLALFF